MIIPTSHTDLGYGVPGTPWDQDKIGAFKSIRRGIPTEVKTWVQYQAGDAATGDYSFKHYVPYNRLLKFLTSAFESDSRRRIIDILDGWLTGLEIDRNWVWANALNNRVEYDAAIEWAIEAICDWKENIYYGPGAGDANGTTVDTPDDAKQYHRVDQARIALNTVLFSQFKDADGHL